MKTAIHYIFLILFLLCSTFQSAANPPHKVKSKAIRLFNKGNLYSSNYYEKESYFKKAIKADILYIDPYWHLAILYTRYDKDQQAIAILQQAIHNNAPQKSTTYLKLSYLEFKNGQYQKAVDAIQLVDTLELDSARRLEYTKSLPYYQNALSLYNQPLDYKPINMQNINTSFDDYFPSITADEQMFCSTVKDRVQHKTNGEDIYRSYKNKGKWSYSKPFDFPINTPENEGSQSFSADGRYIFFVRCGARESFGSCDIYYAQKFGNRWGRIHHFDEPINSSSWDSTPTMSPTGDKLYFSSSRKGGMGGSDIWVADITILENGNLKASKVRNLGSPINTPKNEHSPFIHTDNTTLYFASNGHPGLGGMDIYKATKKDSTEWQNVTNMGYPLNTSGDEFGFTVNAKGDVAYFASNKIETTNKGLEIYQVNIPQKKQAQSMRTLFGKITNANNHKPIQTKVEIYNQLGNRSYSESISDRATGEFTVFLPDTGQYALSINDAKYLFYSANIQSFNDSMTIQLIPVSQDATFQLNNLFFATNQANILPESKGELQQLQSFIDKEANWNFSIEGHTDNVGTQKYNKELSLRRAKAVKQALIELGINPKRLTIKGFGSTQPIADNTTENGRAQNRRVVIRLIKPE
jgi:outer membrane protein OmpA-like peptidoglycan-associated protein/Tol biopolymer transport system component